MNVKRLIPGRVRKNDVSGEPKKMALFQTAWSSDFLFIVRKIENGACFGPASFLFDSSDLRGGCETKRKNNAFKQQNNTARP